MHVLSSTRGITDVEPMRIIKAPVNARLRDLKPELEQFAVDARRPPQRVLDAHAPDQSAQLRADLRPPCCARTVNGQRSCRATDRSTTGKKKGSPRLCSDRDGIERRLAALR
jgi:hypothetical protein